MPAAEIINYSNQDLDNFQSFENILCLQLHSITVIFLFFYIWLWYQHPVSFLKVIITQPVTVVL